MKYEYSPSFKWQETYYHVGDKIIFTDYNTKTWEHDGDKRIRGRIIAIDEDKITLDASTLFNSKIIKINSDLNECWDKFEFLEEADTN